MKNTLTFLLALLLPAAAQAANDFSRASGCLAVWTMDSITSGEPDLEASASSEYSSSYEAWRAFDKTGPPNRWATTTGGVTPCWLEYSWGDGREHIVDKYSMTAYAADGAPNTWTFQGYTGSGWDTLDSQSGITWTSYETKTYTFTNSTAYRAYRVYVTANNGRSTTQLVELDFFRQGTNTPSLIPRMFTNTHAAEEIGDSKGSHTLTVFGNGAAPTIDTSDHKEGSGSLDLEYSNHHKGFVPDPALASGFPLKGGTTNRSFTVTMWIKPESLPNPYSPLWTLNAISSVSITGAWLRNTNWVTFNLWGPSQCTGMADNAISSAGIWYFLAFTHDHATKTARMYVYDSDAESVVCNNTASTTGQGDLCCDYCDFTLGGGGYWYSNNLEFDGLMDEVTVWNVALSVDDINNVRDGTYAPAGGAQMIRIFISQAAPWEWIRQAATFREPQMFILGHGYDRAFIDRRMVLR